MRNNVNILAADQRSASECYSMIHACLGQWIECALGDGFDGDPLEYNHAQELTNMADMMAELEEKMKGQYTND